MSEYTLRLARPEDTSDILNISKSAETKFGQHDKAFAQLAEGEQTYAAKKIQETFEKGQIFLAEHVDKPVGFLATFQKDTALYIAEISVSSDYNGKGIGSMLLKAVLQLARERAIENKESEARVSLTTYVEIPWNGPFYLRRGFKVVEAETIGPEHVEKMRYDKEVRKLWQDGYTRCCMLWTEKV